MDGVSGGGDALIRSVNPTRIKIMITIKVYIIRESLIHCVLSARYDVVVTGFSIEK
jgi:hypothetical protein